MFKNKAIDNTAELINLVDLWLREKNFKLQRSYGNWIYAGRFIMCCVDTVGNFCVRIGDNHYPFESKITDDKRPWLMTLNPADPNFFAILEEKIRVQIHWIVNNGHWYEEVLIDPPILKNASLNS